MNADTFKKMGVTWPVLLICYIASFGCFTRYDMIMASKTFDGNLFMSQLTLGCINGAFYSGFCIEDILCGGDLGFFMRAGFGAD